MEDVAGEPAAEKLFEPPARIEELVQIHPRVDSFSLKDVHEIFGRNVPRCSWGKRTAPKSAEGGVELRDVACECCEHIRDSTSTGVVKVASDGNIASHRLDRTNET